MQSLPRTLKYFTASLFRSQFDKAINKIGEINKTPCAACLLTSLTISAINVNIPASACNVPHAASSRKQQQQVQSQFVAFSSSFAPNPLPKGGFVVQPLSPSLPAALSLLHLWVARVAT